MKDFEGHGDLALSGINCSPMVVKKVHEAFNMTTERKDLEAFSMFLLQFYLKYFDLEEKSLDEISALKTKVEWDLAVLAELAKFKEIEGAPIQCS